MASFIRALVLVSTVMVLSTMPSQGASVSGTQCNSCEGLCGIGECIRITGSSGSCSYECKCPNDRTGLMCAEETGLSNGNVPVIKEKLEVKFNPVEIFGISLFDIFDKSNTPPAETTTAPSTSTTIGKSNTTAETTTPTATPSTSTKASVSQNGDGAAASPPPGEGTGGAVSNTGGTAGTETPAPISDDQGKSAVQPRPLQIPSLSDALALAQGSLFQNEPPSSTASSQTTTKQHSTGSTPSSTASSTQQSVADAPASGGSGQSASSGSQPTQSSSTTKPSPSASGPGTSTPPLQ